MEPKIDPSTKDLAILNERLVEDTTMSTAVMLRVTTERGSVPGMPWFGSRLHTLTTMGDVSVRLAEGYLLESVGDLIRADKVRNVTVRADVEGTTLKWELSWEDQTDQRHTLVSP